MNIDERIKELEERLDKIEKESKVILYEKDVLEKSLLELKEQNVKCEIGKPYQPKDGCENFYITSQGISRSWVWGYIADKKVIENYNVFPTQEEAQKVLDREFALRKLWKIADDLNGGEVLDGYLWMIIIDDKKRIDIGKWQKYYGLPKFKSREDCIKALPLMSDKELCAIFNVDKIDR